MKTLQVDDRTHKRIKLMAVQDGQTMQQVTKLAVEAYAALRTQWKQPR